MIQNEIATLKAKAGRGAECRAAAVRSLPAVRSNRPG